jgi:hypothetical protein
MVREPCPLNLAKKSRVHWGLKALCAPNTPKQQVVVYRLQSAGQVGSEVNNRVDAGVLVK